MLLGADESPLLMFPTHLHHGPSATFTARAQAARHAGEAGEAASPLTLAASQAPCCWQKACPARAGFVEKCLQSRQAPARQGNHRPTPTGTGHCLAPSAPQQDEATPPHDQSQAVHYSPREPHHEHRPTIPLHVGQDQDCQCTHSSPGTEQSIAPLLTPVPPAASPGS